MKCKRAMILGMQHSNKVACITVKLLKVGTQHRELDLEMIMQHL